MRLEDVLKNKMIKNKYIKAGLLLFFTALLYNSCDIPIEIHEWYRIYGNDKYREGYHLMCKLGAEGAPHIENLQSAYWNKQYIIVEQKNFEEAGNNRWYIVKAKGEELVCGNDTLIGPLSKEEKDGYIKANNIKKLKKRKF